MKKSAELLTNLVYRGGYLKATLKEGIAALGPIVNELEVVHIKIDLPDLSAWRKKKYCHISREEKCSRVDEWIYEHLVDQNEYAAYLERYRPALIRGKIDDIDEYIMNTHYRPRAVKILRRKKSFNLPLWTKKRTYLEYQRRSNIYWKDGAEHRLDYRNSVESFFIRKNGSDREVIGIGGGGSSYQRQVSTFFTAVFYLLSKKTRIPHFLLTYNGFNEFEYTSRTYRAIWTPGFGCNFDLDIRLAKEIRDKGRYLR